MFVCVYVCVCIYTVNGNMLLIISSCVIQVRLQAPQVSRNKMVVKIPYNAIYKFVAWGVAWLLHNIHAGIPWNTSRENSKS